MLDKYFHFVQGYARSGTTYSKWWQPCSRHIVITFLRATSKLFFYKHITKHTSPLLYTSLCEHFHQSKHTFNAVWLDKCAAAQCMDTTLSHMFGEKCVCAWTRNITNLFLFENSICWHEIKIICLGWMVLLHRLLIFSIFWFRSFGKETTVSHTRLSTSMGNVLTLTATSSSAIRACILHGLTWLHLKHHVIILEMGPML